MVSARPLEPLPGDLHEAFVPAGIHVSDRKPGEGALWGQCLSNSFRGLAAHDNGDIAHKSPAPLLWKFASYEGCLRPIHEATSHQSLGRHEFGCIAQESLRRTVVFTFLKRPPFPRQAPITCSGENRLPETFLDGWDARGAVERGIH